MIDIQLRNVLVLGTGLIGTSIGLALGAQGVSVTLFDRDPSAVSLAVRRGAGRAFTNGDEQADLAVIAVPPASVPPVLLHAQQSGLARLFTDVASVKGTPVNSARRLGCDMTGFVPGHPMGGGERSGPEAARADLFQGRAWVLCPEEDTCPGAMVMVEELVRLCGARLVTMGVDDHDSAMSLISHTPHLLASAMAAALAGADPETLSLAGAGVQDVTRIAAGDPSLWTEVLAQNAACVAAVLSEIAANLADVAAALQLAGTGDGSYIGDVSRLLSCGVAGRRQLMSPGPVVPADRHVANLGSTRELHGSGRMRNKRWSS